MKHTRVSSQSDIITAAPLTSSIPSEDSSIKALLEVFFFCCCFLSCRKQDTKKILVHHHHQREKTRPCALEREPDAIIIRKKTTDWHDIEKTPRALLFHLYCPGFAICESLLVSIVILSTQRTMRKRLINLYPKQYIICYFALHVYLKEWNGLRSPLAELYRKLAAHPAEAFSGVPPTFLRLSASSQSWMGSH